MTLVLIPGQASFLGVLSYGVNQSFLPHKCQPPSPLLNNIRVIVIFWRLRGNIIRTALCWVV